MPKRWIEHKTDEGIVHHRVRIMLLGGVLCMDSSIEPTPDRDDDDMNTGISVRGDNLSQCGLLSLAEWAEKAICPGIVDAVKDLINEVYPEKKP